ncbi:rhodanese-like domain-containing protein [Mycolicibacterium phlei]|jgi:rhodanese-related sulfurtransferase|uniref:rhodanese-like domain-containing protein n=1 Tax=Mycolicibacterium phlei TaxID=1771 RepID=UPI00025AF653|nr:rhodanese-like domain-containing protein [Mycolicibacterium phlei]EID10271.1 Rhodanese-related sulfurtransferase [Mycolicibacterium phlei RIVM601174]MBF4193964.1 Rhodanese-related sulfurtransferase [Mycolicibacterium phlei]
MTTALTLNPEDLRDMLTSGRPPRLIDVRTPAEFETAHIPGSYNVPLDLLREHRDEIAGHLRDEVVLICRSGKRAGDAEQSLRDAGLTNVHILNGGMLAWEGAGLTVNRGRQRWDLERQVRLTAGSLVLAGILGSVAVPGLKWLAAGVGAGLSVAALTDTCAMGTLLSKLPYNRPPSCDAATVVARLTGN